MSRLPAERGQRGLRTAACLTAIVLAASCGVPGGHVASERGAPLDSLRADVDALREEIDGRVARDSLVQAVRVLEGDAVVGLSTGLVTRMLHVVTQAYLDDVRLHVAPDVVVREGDDVHLSVGPLEVRAGRWDVRVEVERIRARIAADSVLLAVSDTSRLSLTVPVRVVEGRGAATIDFTWDAVTAASVVCRDFALRETFDGSVSPYTDTLRAELVLEADGPRIAARPRYTGERLVVRPEPTPEAWRRVRQILERQNSIFRCGLAISPDEMERLLRRLLRRGFRFEFPASVLQPVHLPTVLTEELTVEGRRFTVAVRPRTLRLGPDRLWYAAHLELSGARP